MFDYLILSIMRNTFALYCRPQYTFRIQRVFFFFYTFFVYHCKKKKKEGSKLPIFSFCTDVLECRFNFDKRLKRKFLKIAGKGADVLYILVRYLFLGLRQQYINLFTEHFIPKATDIFYFSCDSH